MSQWLRQSTAVDVSIGPFLDENDGKTPETALSIAQADVRLKKNGGTFAQKNDASSAGHDENGYYEAPLDATDVNTLGRLRVAVTKSGALPVWHDFMVVPAEVYDAMFGADGGVYSARIWMIDDNGGTTDRYVVVFLKNGQPITAGITSPQIQVVKAADGTDQIAATALTQIASLGLYKHDATSSARLASGAAYIAKITATIDGATRTIHQPVGRDS